MWGWRLGVGTFWTPPVCNNCLPTPPTHRWGQFPRELRQCLEPIGERGNAGREGASMKGNCGYFLAMTPSISCFGKLPSPHPHPPDLCFFLPACKTLLELNSYSLELPGHCFLDLLPILWFCWPLHWFPKAWFWPCYISHCRSWESLDRFL